MNNNINTLLEQIEQEMKQLGYWAVQPPSAESLNSTVPFCADCISFTDWLQWLFIPRVKELITSGQGIPFRSQISPYASYYFSETGQDKGKVVIFLGKLDHILNENYLKPLH